MNYLGLEIREPVSEGCEAVLAARRRGVHAHDADDDRAGRGVGVRADMPFCAMRTHTHARARAGHTRHALRSPPHAPCAAPLPQLVERANKWAAELSLKGSVHYLFTNVSVSMTGACVCVCVCVCVCACARARARWTKAVPRCGRSAMLCLQAPCSRPQSPKHTWRSHPPACACACLAQPPTRMRLCLHPLQACCPTTPALSRRWQRSSQTRCSKSATGSGAWCRPASSRRLASGSRREVRGSCSVCAVCFL
jgi:hypothetical protein